MAQEETVSDLRSVAGRIVVGVDGSRSARHALHWTARWAAFTNMPVTLVAALGKRPTEAEAERGEAPDPQFQDQVRSMIEGEVAYVRDEIRGVDLTYLDVWGEAADVLIEASHHALVLVLGTRGLGGWTGMVLGGVSDKVISDAKGPVVVVPPRWKPVRRGEPVTLAADDPASAGPAVAFAIQAAQAIGTELHVVHAWEVQKRWSQLATTFGAGRVRSTKDHAAQRLEAVCKMVSEQAPDLHVEPRLVEGSPVAVLSQASETARLMVMGSRGRGSLLGLVFGSRGRELVQDSACPVAIIRDRS